MKRILTLALALSLCAAMTGCDVLDYNKAMDYYKAEDYDRAQAMFESLGDYADSAKMADISRQKGDYIQAEALYAAEDYRQALPLYESLDMYMDSPVKAVECQYRIGLDCVANGQYEEALAWLEPLGSYENSQEQVSLAKWLWLYEEASEGLPLYRTDSGTLRLQANEDQTLSFHYEKAGALLGVQYTHEFVLTFDWNSQTGTYRAVYDSSSAGQIKEEAQGTYQLAAFCSTANLSLDSFRQTVVDPDGNETVCEDSRESLMMHGMLAEVKTILSQTIPGLLSQTGVPVTAAELGFESL